MRGRFTGRSRGIRHQRSREPALAARAHGERGEHQQPRRRQHLDIAEGATHPHPHAMRERTDMHMDGARIFNAMAGRHHARPMGPCVPSISICLSKASAPVGSVLTGTHVHRPGTARSQTLPAVACDRPVSSPAHARMDHHMVRLKDDHRRAARLEQVLRWLPWVRSVMPVETNIVVFGARAR